MPSNNNKPLYYWDTCILIAWLKDEKRPNNEMSGVLEVAEKIQSKEAVLITSQQTNVELLECRLPAGAIDKINRFFSRKNARMVSVDGRVGRLAQSIRNWNPRITSIDATHLATAIHYEVNQFHTFDNGKKGGVSLLSLNGNVDGHNLAICKPPYQQQRFSF